MKRVMNRNNFLRVAGVAILIGMAAFVLIAVWPLAEPHYQGQPLSLWLGVYWRGITNRPAQAESAEAVLQMGTNAFPCLINMIRARDSFLKQEAIKWSAKQKVIKFNFTTATERRYLAQCGYSILGPAAKSQVPELTRILTNDTVAEVRQCVAAALGSIGPDARSAVPALFLTAKDKDHMVRNNSLWALGRIHGDPNVIIPRLIEGLGDSFSVARENAAIALGYYGPLASNAVPILLRTRATNNAASDALFKIDPNWWAAVKNTK